MVEVQVKQGRLLGEKLNTYHDMGQYYSFKGIPYAQPPVNELRFQAPRPLLPWKGVRKATALGPKCPQMDLFTDNIQLGNEDCLYLNVYTPELTPANKLPVMFFIHGGSFKSGSGNTTNYGPDFLMPHGVVFVTFGYRLEVLGLLCLDTEVVPGNAGMKDQVAALRWVRDNIVNFGGDPNNVTIIGHNSGAVCAALHMLSPMSKGLFKRVIIMSGVPSCDWAIDFEHRKRAFILGKELGLETSDPNELAEYLRKISVEKLLNKKPSVMAFENVNCNVFKMEHFTPVVEKDFGQERFLTNDPTEILKSGRFNDVDVLLGHTSEEALLGIAVFRKTLEKLIVLYNRFPELLVPRKIQLKCTPGEILALSERIHEHYFQGKPISIDRDFIRYISHSAFAYDINSFMSKLPKIGDGRRYKYRFSCFSSRNYYGNIAMKYVGKGASHLDDLMYLLHAVQYDKKVVKDTRECRLVEFVTTIFSNFAKYGNPTPDSSLGVIWPEYDNENKYYADIGDTLTIGTNPIGADFDFWEDIYRELEI